MNRIKEVIEERGETIREAAQRAEMDPSYLGKVAAGRISPSIATAHRIAAALGRPLEEVFPAPASAA